jgi:hypothetical protein
MPGASAIPLTDAQQDVHQQFMESKEVGCLGDAARPWPTSEIPDSRKLDRTDHRQMRHDQQARRKSQELLVRVHRVRFLCPADLPLANLQVLVTMPTSERSSPRYRGQTSLSTESHGRKPECYARRFRRLFHGEMRPHAHSREKQGRRSWTTRLSPKRDAAGLSP